MKKRTRNMFTKSISIEELVYAKSKKRTMIPRKQKQQEFREEIKVDTSSKFDKKVQNYSIERRAQMADEQRKRDYLRAIDKLNGYER